MEDIPEDEDKCSAWLHKLYQEKVGVPSCGVKGGHWSQLLLPLTIHVSGSKSVAEYIIRWPHGK